MIVLLLFYILFPALMIWLCSRVKLLGKIGPIFLLYLVGIILGNSGILPEGAYSLQDILTSATIPLAIPLMLFSTNIRPSLVKSTLLATASGVVAVVVVVVAGFFILESNLESGAMVGDNGAKLAGLLCGVYTGGTPNLAALKMMLDVEEQTYIIVHSYDMIVSLSYLVMLLAFGIKMFRWILPVRKSEEVLDDEPLDMVDEENYSEIFTRHAWLPTLRAVGLSLLIVGLSVGLAFALTGEMSMVVIILSLTTLGLCASRVKSVRTTKTSFSAGMYLVLIFSLVVSSMADFAQMDFVGGAYILLYLVAVVFGSLLIQTLLSRLLRIDADTMIASSVSLINSPPFVPMICSAMRNRDVLVVGLSVGIVGYAVGNYLGFIVYQLLSTFC